MTNKKMEISHRYDVLLEVMAYAAEQLLYALHWEKNINKVLQRLGETVGARRAYIFENHRDGQGQLLASQRYEWAAPGIEPQINNAGLQNFSYDHHGLSRWPQLLGKGRIIHGRIRDFPLAEQAVLLAQDIQSIAVVPICVRDRWWGFIGFDSTRHERLFSSAEENALKTLASIFGAALSWRTITNAQEENRRQLESHLSKERFYKQLFDAIGRVQSLFIQDADPSVLFGNVLQEALALSKSRLGLLGEIRYRKTGAPYIKTLAASNAAYNTKLCDCRTDSSLNSAEIAELKNLFCTVITSGKAAMVNDIPDNSRLSRASSGGFKIKRFLALPFYHRDSLLGIIGVANSDKPYDKNLAHYLAPLLSTCGGILGAYHNDQRRREAEIRLHLIAKVFESTIEGVIITDAQAGIVDVNKAFTHITGIAKQEIIGQPLTALHAKPEKPASIASIWRAIKSTNQWQGELWSRRKNGDIFPTWMTINAIRSVQGKITNYVAVFSDITIRKQTEQRLYYLAHHDTLTGLPNRTLFLDRLKHAVTQAHRRSHHVAVLFIDLDRFKFINDTLGHGVGDILLKQAATRMQTSIRAEDTIARLGGDEFTVIIESFVDPAIIPLVARKIIKACEKPFFINNKELFISASIGISLYPDDGHDAETLLQHADAAMYRAKEKGKNNYQFFAAEMNTAAAKRLALENRLRKAIAQREFQLYYQPIMNMENGAIVSVEALIRWVNPELGLMLPDKFIPLAEETGLIVPIGEWVLQTACTQAKIWNQDSAYPVRIAINLSARQLQQSDFFERILAILKKTAFLPSHLELELTEGMLMENTNASLEILNALKKMGCRISLDDFGTGYSSLAYLKRFPIDTVKIDHSFIQDVDTDPDDAAITMAVTTMARSLRRKVIAEGVETRAQLEFLDKIGVNEVQGYFISHPTPAENLTQLLRERKYFTYDFLRL